MKLSIKKYSLTLGFLLVLVPAFAQQTLSLDSILQVIRQNNPMLRQYELQEKAYEAYTEGATEWMAPMVGVGTFMTPYPGQEPMSPDNKGSLMLSFEQSIPNPAKQRANKAWYGSRAAVAEARQEAAYNELRAEAKKAYYQWVVLEKKDEILKESERIMKTMQKLAEIRYPYAQGSLGSIYKAEGRLYEVQNMIEMVEGEMEERNIRLNTLMALPADLRYQPDTTLHTMPVNAGGNGADNGMGIMAGTAIDTARLAAGRSDIEAMNRSIRSMRLNQELMRTEGKPEFGIRFDHMSPYGGMMPHQFTLMGMVSIPIAPWSARGYKSQVKGMEYEIGAMQQEREAMLIEAVGMLEEMRDRLQRMHHHLQNYRERIIPALRKNFQVTMLAYEENQEQLPMVIDAWETLNMTQMTYLDQLQEYYRMLAEYEKELEI